MASSTIHLAVAKTYLKQHPNLNQEEVLAGTLYPKFHKDLYDAYDYLSQYITEKYHLTKEDYQAYPNLYFPTHPYQPCLFTKEQIDAFIARVASISLEDYLNALTYVIPHY